MRTDFDLLSTAPPEEPAAENLGEARRQARRYIDLIRSTIGPEPVDSQLKFHTNAHDLGDYGSVTYLFDDQNEEHIAYMRKIENDGPLNWEG